jgi:DoxX-like family
MSSKIRKVIGWILSGLLALVFAGSAFMKLSQNPEAIARAASFGFSSETNFMIGLIEIVSLILFLIRRTGVLGGMLLVAYLGGAIATTLQHQQPVAIPIIVQILLWITMYIRFPALPQRLLPTSNNK